MSFIANMFSYVGWVLLAIMILVFVHELGHFLFAKLFKMRVDKFSVGFPPKVLGFTRGDTEYVLGLTPLGGYVKIAGMVDESMDTEELASEPQAHEFRAKPVWQRILVITGGVLFNIILAAVIFAGLKATYGEMYVPSMGPVRVDSASIAYDMGIRTGDQVVAVNGTDVSESRAFFGIQEMLLADPLRLVLDRNGQSVDVEGPGDMMTRLNRTEGRFGISFDPAVVGSVVEGSPAALAGLQEGDRIVAVDSMDIHFWSDISAAVVAADGNPVRVTVVRSSNPYGPDAVSRTIDFTITPEETNGSWLLGISQVLDFREFGPIEAVGAGIADTWVNTRLIATSLKRVFSGQDDFRENVLGPVMIARATKEAADRGAPFFWNIVAVLSITLAIINIMPIPALDGGHLMFLIYEGIVRKEPSLKVRMVMQQIGMVILLLFMVFVIFNDFLKL